MNESGSRPVAGRPVTVALVAHWDWVIFNFRLPLARALRDAGAEVVLVCPRGGYTDRLLQEGFRWVPWQVDRRGMNPLREAGAIRELAAFYRNEGFDLVQHFTIKPNLYGTVAAARARVPAVVNLFSGLGFVFSDHRLARLVRLCASALLKRLLRRPGTISVFQNEADLQRFVRMGLVPIDRARLIRGTGVDTRRFTPDPSRREEPPLVLMACRLIKQKGVNEFVQAAAILKSRGVAARCVVAGEPDEGNPAAIPREQLDRWKAERVVEWVGQVDDVVPLLQEAAVAVLPTYYPEGIPKFLLEAAAVGLPLVASDIPACREIVEHGRNGFLVPPRDAPALADALETLLIDPELRARLGRRSREIAVQRFDQEVVVRSYLQLYSALGVPLD